MTPHTLAIHAVTAEYVRQMLQSLVPKIGIVLGLSIGLSVFFALQVSAWWWLLAIPIIFLTGIGVIIWLRVRSIITRLSPKLTDAQRSIAIRFASKAQIVTGTLKTPYFITVLYVIRYVVFRRNFDFIEVLAIDTTVLQSDFEELRKSF